MIATFAATFITMYVAHHFADHWVQTDGQAKTKGERGAAGRIACLKHVYTLTTTQLVLLALVHWVMMVDWNGVPFALGLALNAGTHYWIDRRFTLAALCDRINKGGFYRMGTGLGTGAYALDQSAHMLFLFLAALVMVF